jgi:ligand-binding SRPBCC domain-containing protein
MTVLENSIRIDAPPEKVWAVLASLDVLDQYDPGIEKSEIISPERTGSGTSRRCDLAAGGWFKEKVVTFEPHRAISFELFECTLPVRRLRHDYTLTADGGCTLVRQRMEYELKMGLVGRLLDAVMVRRKWDTGIKGFFSGLKQYVEAKTGSDGSYSR